MVDSSSPLLGHTGAARWRLSRKARAVALASIAAALAVVAVLALVDTPRPAVLLLPAYPQKARFQSLFFGHLAKAFSKFHNAVKETAQKVVNHVVDHVCNRWDAKFCPNAPGGPPPPPPPAPPINTDLPPLDPIFHSVTPPATRDITLPSLPPLDPISHEEDLPAVNERATDSLGLPVLDGNGQVMFDSGGYATNAYTLSDWEAHPSGWIYQGDMDDGPQYTVDEISGKLGVELHDPTFNAISDLDDSVHNWADTADTDPNSVDPWLQNVGGNIY